MVNQQRPRSVNNVSIDIFMCLGRRELEEWWNLFFKIDFNKNTKIVLAVLKRFIGHKTSSIKYGSQSTVALLNTKVYIAF